TKGPRVLNTTKTPTPPSLPAAPSASHHRGAWPIVTTPQTSWAEATTEKNARSWVLPRPTVAAAATLIAPAARLARAIAHRTRGGVRCGSALRPLGGTGRDTGLVSLHRISADIFPSPCSPA